MTDFTEVITKKYAQFSGRARRREYWMFTLISSVIAFLLGLVDGLLGLEIGDGASAIGLLGGLFSLIIFIPSLAVTVRRLHDTGRSGWWILISIVPLLGWIAIIVFLVTDSAYGSNKWGLNPKAPAGLTPTPAQNW